ncbi:MAG TPA: phage holin family protein [Opitutaceae bacterium]|nr:phage holin family protein [Opitutaceae bacterium]
MDTHAPSPTGLLGSLRSFADGLVGSVHDRLELLGVELQEEKLRLIQILMWVGAVVILALMAIVFASIAVLVMFWETARIAAALSLAGLYTAGLVGVVLAFRKYLARQPKPFAGTLAELRGDRTCIREQS